MISFVILHYKSIDETIECLKCLKENIKEKISIIVVDNHSFISNEIEQVKKYTEDILIMDDNIGFAKANNIGCNYAIEKYKPDFICVINNDVFITQKDFIKTIKDDYNKYNFDVLGPFIESRTGESVNPFPNIVDLDSYIKRTKKLINIYKSPFKYTILKILLKVKKIFVKKEIAKNGKSLKENVCLHGCALVFSKKYYKKYNDIFYNDTYLFHEEEFIYNRVIKDGLISIYDPKLRVYHKEGSSMNKNVRLSKLFKEEEKLKSLELLKIEKEENN